LSQLRISRPKKAWQDKLRAYKVLVDDQEVGEIKQQGDLVLPVAPGRHVVQLKLDWCCSPKIDIEVSKGSTLPITCGPNSHPLLVLLYVTLLRKQYIWLRVPASNA